ncbi:DEKNAAC100681 [Brettanomyces naardenensis]|uniref:DEKNAAC100681 n=1 Tax=Brettanomyces naardenensis TaxID=13370 RepID=A0A448YF60_BRENA|nr:DEKNAAC100681 [Brettanomyces naardenensis]
MPKHALNKPKKTLVRSQKGRHLGKKRAASKQRILELESSNTNELVPNTELTASASGVITNRVVSKKRAKKNARNIKYINARSVNGTKLLVDLQAKKDLMEVDGEEEEEDKGKSQKKSDPIREALWSVVADVANGGLKIDSTGEGTTLGGPSF